MTQSPDVRLVTEARLPVLVEELGIGGSGIETVSGAVTLDSTGDPIREFYTTGATTFKANGVDTVISSFTALVWKRGATGTWSYKAVTDGWTTPEATPDAAAPTWTATLTVGTPTDKQVVVTASALATDDKAIDHYEATYNGTTWTTITPGGTTGREFILTGTAGQTYTATKLRAVDTAGKPSTALTVPSYTMAAAPPPAGVQPSAITGLAAWYDASDASTITATSGTISAWADKSGAGRTMVQATASKQPVLLADAMGAGLPAVDFDGVDDVLTGPNPSIATDYTVWWTGIARGTDRYLLGHANAEVLTNGLRAVVSQPSGASSTAKFTDGQKVVIVARWSSTGQALWLGTNKTSSSTANTVTLQSTAIGARLNGTSPTDSSCASTGYYSRALTDAEVTDLIYGQANKWGVSV